LVEIAVSSRRNGRFTNDLKVLRPTRRVKPLLAIHAKQRERGAVGGGVALIDC
jgi:hypothetical protein